MANNTSISQRNPQKKTRLEANAEVLAAWMARVAVHNVTYLDGGAYYRLRGLGLTRSDVSRALDALSDAGKIRLRGSAMGLAVELVAERAESAA